MVDDPAEYSSWGEGMGWIVRLVETGPAIRRRRIDVMEIDRSGDLAEIDNLGLSLAEGKRLLERVQREVVVAQAREHAGCRPRCGACGGKAPGEGLSDALDRHRFRPRGPAPSPLSVCRVRGIRGRSELAAALSLNTRAGSAEGLSVGVDEHTRRYHRATLAALQNKIACVTWLQSAEFQSKIVLCQ